MLAMPSSAQMGHGPDPARRPVDLTAASLRGLTDADCQRYLHLDSSDTRRARCHRTATRSAHRCHHL